MNIVDIFPYFNERELLELRINLLHDHVDQFIICDANRTHSGKPKEFSAKQTLIELGLMSSKVQVIEVDLSEYDHSTDLLPNWTRERAQRNSAASYVTSSDICFVSDCDEIVNPSQIDYYVSVAVNNRDKICRLPMVNLCARADLQVCDQQFQPREWNSGGFVCLQHHLDKHTLSQIRESWTMKQSTTIDYSNVWLTDNHRVNSAGWHFSWMGGTDKILDKNKSFMHANDHIDHAVYTYSSQSLETFMASYTPTAGGTDPLGRTNHLLMPYPVDLLPRKIFELPEVERFLLPTTLHAILEKTPFLPTDKNTVCFIKFRNRWMYGDYCHSYFENFYERELARYRNRPIKLCEIGIDTGASMFIWNKYFHQKSTLLGIDISDSRLIYQDTEFNNVSYIFKDAYYSNIADCLTNFDIIIDDGPHSLESQLKFIELYLPKLNNHGILVIEDVASQAVADALMDSISNKHKYIVEVVDLVEVDNRFDSRLLVIRS